MKKGFNMRVILITHGKVNPNGHNGISRVVYNLNRYSKLEGIESEIWSVVDGIKEEYLFERDEFVKVRCFPRINPMKGTKSDICKKIIEEKETIDLIHFHMPWLLDKLYISKICLQYKIPYIVTGHSAYSASQKQTWKMKLGKLYEIPFLNNARAVHAITREESSEFKKFGVKTNIFVIPNSIDDPYVNYDKEKIKYCRNEGIINFLFMGELRAQKNIDGLINAVSLLEDEIKKKVCFKIVGPDSNNNLSKYKKLVEELKLEKQFEFLGGIFEEERKKLFVESDAYITPSLSEVVSLSAIEAMAYGKPCVLTRQSDVSYFYNYGFFCMCENYSEDIARGISELILNYEHWEELSEKSRICYENNFTWAVNIKKFHDMYIKYKKDRG